MFDPELLKLLRTTAEEFADFLQYDIGIDPASVLDFHKGEFGSYVLETRSASYDIPFFLSDSDYVNFLVRSVEQLLKNDADLILDNFKAIAPLFIVDRDAWVKKELQEGREPFTDDEVEMLYSDLDSFGLQGLSKAISYSEAQVVDALAELALRDPATMFFGKSMTLEGPSKSVWLL